MNHLYSHIINKFSFRRIFTKVFGKWARSRAKTTGTSFEYFSRRVSKFFEHGNWQMFWISFVWGETKWVRSRSHNWVTGFVVYLRKMIGKSKGSNSCKINEKRSAFRLWVQSPYDSMGSVEYTEFYTRSSSHIRSTNFVHVRNACKRSHIRTQATNGTTIAVRRQVLALVLSLSPVLYPWQS